MSKPQPANKISPELQRLVADYQRAGTLDTVVTGTIRFASNVYFGNIEAMLKGFERHYHGFKAGHSPAGITSFQSPARYIRDLAEHEAVVEIKLPIEYHRA